MVFSRLGRFVAHRVVTGWVLRAVPVCLASALASGCGQGPPNVESSGGDLTTAELHEIAWPAGREAYNDKFAGTGQAEYGIEITALDEGAYAEPTSISSIDGGWVVVYGGAPAGPSIQVKLGQDGAIEQIQVWHAVK